MTRTINVTDEAYEALRGLKRPRESFTDVILRLAGRRSLGELAGILSGPRGDAFQAAIREGRAKSRARQKRMTKAR